MKHLLLLWFCLILTVSIFGCISSEESGSSSQQQPITQQEPSDSAVQGTQNAARPAQAGQKGSRLTSRQDTLVASVTRKAKPASRSRLVRPKNPLYTVQVGVFRKPQNALRYQKLAKERFPRNSVHNRYDTKTKMYWVSIGKFTTKQEAVALRRTVIDKYPKDYKEAWVNYIPR